MPEEIELRLAPEIAFQEEELQQYIKDNYNNQKLALLKRSVDSRKAPAKVVLRGLLYTEESELEFQPKWTKDLLKDVSNAEEVLIVGAGPAGLFAALKAIELGLKPIILERGKDVQARRIDLANINKKDIVNPESNYCFGEGGAGTYSDGKLYTRSKKRGDVNRILEILVAHGADTNILIEAHPHIGTNKLPKIIQSIREQIIEFGGKVIFDAKVTNFIIKENVVKGVEINGSEKREAKAVLLATGHSARDIFHLLAENKVLIHSKPFALGVRVEHPQNLIDNIQYHCSTDRGEFLPAAAYSVVQQVNFKKQQWGVFSFCMCPGGFIVPSATSPGEIVVNGMSPSRRDSKYANSGIVVAVDDFDFKPFEKDEELRALSFQQSVEQKCFEMANGTQKAPAQRLVDFVEGKTSSTLPDTSYIPGLTASNLKDVLPEKVSQVLKEGFKAFGKKLKGYYTNDAQVVATESRTSSPVNIPRDKVTLEHPEVKGLFPCGEGAGYAGGIMSAAIDGEKCMSAIFVKVKV